MGADRVQVNRIVQSCICGADSWTEITGARPKFGVLQCDGCGIKVQNVEMDPVELAAWYRDKYHAGVYTHSQDHDRKVAKERIKAYGPKVTGRTLDVGCGLGAFVRELLDLGIEAEGQDLAFMSSADWFHRGDLESCNFPTDRYDLVTCHDVLEHVPAPLPFLSDCHRVLRPGGWFIIDFPDFEFDRHWKETEHLWFLTAFQLIDVLRVVGFDVRYRTTPVEGKICIYATKERDTTRPSILLPPGIGDSYWSVVKIPGFAKQLQAPVVDLWLSDPDDKQRSLEWIRKIPWASARGYVRHRVTAPAFHEAYMQNGRYLFEQVEGCDYFMAFNGVMRHGKDIDKIEQSWGSEWFPPMHESPDQRKAERDFLERFGPYIVAYFVEHGMYKSWLSQMSVGRIVQELIKIKERGFEVVFMGAGWDVNGLPSMLAGATGAVDLCGETTIDQMFGLINGSSGVIGWPAGNTIMATVLRKETLLFWNDYFDRRFWKLSCPPDSRSTWYHWTDTRQDPGPAIQAFMERVGPADG